VLVHHFAEFLQLAGSGYIPVVGIIFGVRVVEQADGVEKGVAQSLAVLDPELRTGGSSCGCGHCDYIHRSFPQRDQVDSERGAKKSRRG
jgi:hypothetical protein